MLDYNVKNVLRVNWHELDGLDNYMYVIMPC